MKAEQPRERLTFILETPGGSIEVVQRIVETLRHHYRYVDFIVPNTAYSAGTVLVMSGDAIYMNYYSRLGPIDPQVMSATGATVPALGYLIAWDRLLAKAKNGELTEVEARVMIENFDQAEMYQFEQARELSIALLEEWLANYKFRDWEVTESQQTLVTAEMKQERAAEIARELNNTDRWHSHGHGISMDVLRQRLNLKIDDYDDAGTNPGLGKLIKDYYVLFEEYSAIKEAEVVLHHPGRYYPMTL